MNVHDTYSHEPVFCFSQSPLVFAVTGEAALSSPALGHHAALFWSVDNQHPAFPDRESVCDTIRARGRHVLGQIFSTHLCYTTFRRCTAWFQEVGNFCLLWIDKARVCKLFNKNRESESGPVEVCKFIFSRIKKGESRKYKSSLQLCGVRKSRYILYGKLPTCAA